MPPSDPKHVPDIVSGHASSIFDPTEDNLSPNQIITQPANSGMAPPSRPPRKSKRLYRYNEKNETDEEVSSANKYICSFCSDFLHSVETFVKQLTLIKRLFDFILIQSLICFMHVVIFYSIALN